MTPQEYTISDIVNIFATIQEMDMYFPELNSDEDIYTSLDEEDMY